MQFLFTQYKLSNNKHSYTSIMRMNEGSKTVFHVERAGRGGYSKVLGDHKEGIRRGRKELRGRGGGIKKEGERPR